MACWLAVDHGHKRIGVAAGYTEDGIAMGVTVLSTGAEEELFARIGSLVAEYGAAGVVVGWPLNMDDTEGPQALAARGFAGRLAESAGLDVRLWDERLSSFQADQALAGHLTRNKRRRRQDAIAAADFLQDFFHGDGPTTAPRPDEIDGKAGG
jgi:putative Holliday junction resolvase